MQAPADPPAAVAPSPAPAATPSPPARMVLSRRDGTLMVASQDAPLVLSKAGKLEYALLRQAVFLTTSVTTTRAPERTDGPADAYGWTFKSYLQRQVCFTSMTGLFSCTAGEIEPLTSQEEGQAPLETAESFPLADAARDRLAGNLRSDVQARFDTDRRIHIEPVLKASGVMVMKATPAAAERGSAKPR